MAKIFDDPDKKVRLALEAFKELVEREAKPRIDRRSEVVEACEAAPPRGGGLGPAAETTDAHLRGALERAC